MTGLTETTPTAFVKLLGSVPAIKIIDFLTENRRDSWSLTEIATEGKMAYPSVKAAMPALTRAGIVKATRRIGRIALYTIDAENPIGARLLELHKTIILHSVRVTVPATR